MFGRALWPAVAIARLTDLVVDRAFGNATAMPPPPSSPTPTATVPLPARMGGCKPFANMEATYGAGTWTKYDLTQWNPEYSDRLHARVIGREAEPVRGA